MGDAPRHLVESGEYGNRVLDELGAHLPSAQTSEQNRQDQARQKRMASGGSRGFTQLHHAAHLPTKPAIVAPVRS
jgi:hypothetical protein